MNLTREETALVELGRNLDFWRVLNQYFPENEECGNKYDSIETAYQDLEDAIEIAGEATGINQDDEPYMVVIYTARKPKGTRPPF